MALETLSWSPHPFHRPGPYVVVLLQGAVALGLLADAAFDGRLAAMGTLGATLGLVIIFLALLFVLPLLPRQHRKKGVLGALGLTIVAALLAFLGPEIPYLGAALGYPALVLGAVADIILIIAEYRRRDIRITLEKDQLEVFVRRYRIEHKLPLEAVRDVRAARTTRGRLFGYGMFEATTRKDAMKDNVSRPVVGEEPPTDATQGNGWDTEGRFFLVAAHPYKKVRTALENRIVLARMSPSERKEQELAYRLAEDLDRIEV